MSTITIKTHVVTEGTKEIALPCYMKDPAHFFKVFSDKQCIMITEMNEGGNHAIRIEDSYMAFGSDKNQVSNEEEFNAAFDRISKILSDLK